MGYTEKEQSLISGEPIELYCFNKDDQFWTYTTGNVLFTFDGKDYEPVLIRRGDIELTANSLKNLLKIEVDRTNIFAIDFISAPIEGIIELTLYRGHGTNPANYVTYWKGSVSSVRFKPKIALIIASPKTNSLNRSGLMRRYQRSCGYVIYSTRCTILKAGYQISGQIANINGTLIEAAIFGTKANGWLVGGWFEAGDKSQMIVWHEGNYIRIAHRIFSLTIGMSFDAYAGCNHAGFTCKNKFSNKINYGGQEFIPDKNPFVGDSVAV